MARSAELDDRNWFKSSGEMRYPAVAIRRSSSPASSTTDRCSARWSRPTVPRQVVQPATHGLPACETVVHDQQRGLGVERQLDRFDLTSAEASREALRDLYRGHAQPTVRYGILDAAAVDTLFAAHSRRTAFAAHSRRTASGTVTWENRRCRTNRESVVASAMSGPASLTTTAKAMHPRLRRRSSRRLRRPRRQDPPDGR